MLAQKSSRKIYKFNNFDIFWYRYWINLKGSLQSHVSNKLCKRLLSICNLIWWYHNNKIDGIYDILILFYLSLFIKIFIRYCKQSLTARLLLFMECLLLTSSNKKMYDMVLVTAYPNIGIFNTSLNFACYIFFPFRNMMHYYNSKI